jgi:hypothetical protein
MGELGVLGEIVARTRERLWDQLHAAVVQIADIACDANLQSPYESELPETYALHPAPHNPLSTGSCGCPAHSDIIHWNCPQIDYSCQLL